MLALLLFAAVWFLAYSDGANDNFRGVGSPYGSKTAWCGECLTWAAAARERSGIRAAPRVLVKS